jgi:monovalent cation:H+ antiporter-2, CPA2 family
MQDDPLAVVLILLAASVLVVTLARRVGLPTTLGYVGVGMLLGPYVLGWFGASDTSRLLAELGVVFLLFTLGLEFSWPRMVAMRREVFGVGSAQMLITAAIAALIAIALGIPWLPAVALGGAVAVSSTAIILQQLTEQDELNRTHGRMAFSVLLFQDLAFVPFLVLAGALSSGSMQFSLTGTAAAVGLAVLAVALVVVSGRFLLRPLLHEMAHSRLRELFTLAVLCVVLAAAWVSHAAGVSMATGAFLAGMMLAETEYRHQVEAVIRPFRDILLGLFFISVGMMLDLHILQQQWPLIILIVLVLLLLKIAVMWPVGRLGGLSSRQALRTAIVLGTGGEFGIAILTILIQGRVIEPLIAQPLLVALVVSMVGAPLLLRYNRRIAALFFGEPADTSHVQPQQPAQWAELASREHVLVCGFGRVGQHVSRVLGTQGFEFIALDLDPSRVRAARGAGLPVLYGDAADEALLQEVGLMRVNAVIITFAEPVLAVGIVDVVRRLRPDVPILVRTVDDQHLTALQAAGATEVVPDTFESSLMLASHALQLLGQPAQEVMQGMDAIRAERYRQLRGLWTGEDERLSSDSQPPVEEIRAVVLPPQAWGVGRSIGELSEALSDVTVSAVRRHGIVGPEPAGSLCLQAGDELVLAGLPSALAHAEQILLTG